MNKGPRLVTFRGETRTLTEWSRLLGIASSTLDKRDRDGRPLDERQRPKRKATHVQPGDGPRATEHPLYKMWTDMRNRCQNPKSQRWARYGAKGITVCERWNESFWDFVADMGPRPPKHSIDRIDNAKGYEPGNCRWATHREQQLNRPDNRLVTWEGETLPVSIWADRFGVTFHQMWGRLYHNDYDMVKAVRSVERLKARLAG
jgi:hypothetical protein